MLRAFKYDSASLLDAWIKNPQQVRQDAAIPEQKPGPVAVEESTCGVCGEDRPDEGSPVSLDCGHYFCGECWDGYLSSKITDGQVNAVVCPAYQCATLVPRDKIEALVSPEMARKFLRFDIEAFVEANPLIRWCPAPGCGLAVQVQLTLTLTLTLIGCGLAVQVQQASARTVTCGSGHFFCWSCDAPSPHEPTTCEQWAEWCEESRARVGDIAVSQVEA